MKLSYFPQIKIIHTSKIFYGQLYIPLANWLLMIGTVIVTAVYNNVSKTTKFSVPHLQFQTTRLGHAYGVCVILVTFITTAMVSIVALVIWKLHWTLVLFGFLVFGALDGYVHSEYFNLLICVGKIYETFVINPLSSKRS